MTDEKKNLAYDIAERLREQFPNEIVGADIIDGKIHISLTPKPESLSDLCIPSALDETYGRGHIVGEIGEYKGIEFIKSEKKYKNKKGRKRSNDKIRRTNIKS